MYLIDSNVLMSAADRIYPFDVVPGYWDQVLAALSARSAAIPASVKSELTVYRQKWLYGWVTANIQNSHVLAENQNQIRNLATVTQWVVSGRTPSYQDSDRTRFLSGADPRIIAAAMDVGGTIVTYEKPLNDPNAKKVKIPDVAAHFGIDCVTPIEMFRRLGMKL